MWYVSMDISYINRSSLGSSIIFFYFLTLQYCIGSATHQNESATGTHVLPIPSPPPPLPTPSPQVVPEYNGVLRPKNLKTGSFHKWIVLPLPSVWSRDQIPPRNQRMGGWGMAVDVDSLNCLPAGSLGLVVSLLLLQSPSDPVLQLAHPDF